MASQTLPYKSSGQRDEMNDEPAAAETLRSDYASAARELEKFITRSPSIFGGADIYNLAFGASIARAGMFAAVLTGLVDDKRCSAVRKFVVVVPPGTNRADAVEAAWTQYVESFEFLANRPVSAHEIGVLKARLSVEVAADRRHTSVARIIEMQAERAAIIVIEAASYRDDTVEAYIAPGTSTPLQFEDVWAPQLHALASVATKLAGEKALYVALDADEPSPRRQALSHLLLTVEGCGVMGSSSDEAPETILASHVDLWDAWIREGRLGQALQDVAALPPSLDREKDYRQIQLLYRAGHHQEALQAIRKWLTLDSKVNASSRVKLARMAQDANASALAAELLAPVSNALDSREDLESALGTARDARLTEIEATIARRYEALFPGSRGLQWRQLRQLARDGDYAGAAAFAKDTLSDSKVATYYRVLARHFGTQQIPDYRALIAEAGPDEVLADALRMASVANALSRKLLIQAFDLAMPLPSTSEQIERGERLLLETLEAVLLVVSKDQTWPITQDQFQAAMLALIERLAASPDNRVLRVGLVEIMQPTIAGSVGLALMAMVVLKLASRPIELRKGAAPGRANMDWLIEREPFLKAGFAWLKAEEPIVIGRSMLPADLLTEPADEVVSAITNFLLYAPPGTFDDTNVMLIWLAFGAAVAPHSSDPDFDLRLIRLVAGKLATAGKIQQARDLAEQALNNSTASARRRRLGWFAMADVYTRGGNAIEGLLAIACTLAADNSGDEEEVYQEITGVARLFRDCGLHDEASAVTSTARGLLERMGLLDRYGHQLDTLELQLRQINLSLADNPDAALTALLDDVVANGRDVLSHNNFTAPAGALLGQILRIAKFRGLVIPRDADEIFDALQRHAWDWFGELVATISAAQPTAEQLLAATQALGPSRYSDDVGFDMRHLGIAAGRALASDNLISDPEEAAFVLDLLADRGVALPGWDEAAAPAPLPATIGETAELARTISRAGVSVVQMGFDEDGRLVRLATSKGSLGQPVREAAEVILEERFKQWAVEYPYAYGIDEVTPNLFYTTTADLRLSQLPEGAIVVAADVSFQAFPPNLLFVDGQFAGRTRPMATTPSLAWLGRARQLGHVGDGRYCSWISTAVGGGSQTLSMIAERLQSTFENYGFTVDNGPMLPATFAGATLAVVTAHGGVHPEGRYFQVVSDEGMLRVTATDLANALRNIGVAVLFVCSGGRADKHPAANTMLGLAKQILDRGCSAVIASPWPLDSRVPSHWLPAFLGCWTKGAMLIEANFHANQVVDQRFAQDPARGLAMAVYGNPELAITPLLRSDANQPNAK